MKKLLFALAGILLAASALAELTKYKDWDKSPEAYFLTTAERAEWKNVATDEDADKFIALYYAKRGGEAFKQEISRRIAAADQQFKMQRYKRGADSVRGHLLIVMGTPSRVSQSRAQEGALDDRTGVTAPGIDTRAPVAESAAINYTWTYNADKFPPAFEIGEVRADIKVDPRPGPRHARQRPGGREGHGDDRREVDRQSQCDADGAPAAAAGAAKVGAGRSARGHGCGLRAPAAAPAAAPTMPLPAAVKTSLEGVAGKATGDAGFWSGTFRSAAGDSFLAIQFYLASNKPAFASATPLKFGAIVTDESGKEVDSFWEDATFVEVARGRSQGPRVRPFRHPAAGQLQGDLRPLRGRGAGPGGIRVGQLQARAEVDRLRRLAADPLQRPGAADQAPRSRGSVRLRRREADQGRAQGRPHVLEDRQPLVLLRRREPLRRRARRPMRRLRLPARPRRLPPMRPSPAS